VRDRQGWWAGVSESDARGGVVEVREMIDCVEGVVGRYVEVRVAN